MNLIEAVAFTAAVVAAMIGSILFAVVQDPGNVIALGFLGMFGW